MITYEANDSPFFRDHQDFCKRVEQNLRLECSGFCNSYGYDFHASLPKSGFTFKLRFHKSQVTRNGVVVPEDAAESSGTEITVNGINKSYRLRFGRSALMRLFMTKTIRRQIPSPYFIFISKVSSPGNIADSLALMLIQLNASSLILRKGKLICKIPEAVQDPEKLIKALSGIIEQMKEKK